MAEVEHEAPDRYSSKKWFLQVDAFVITIENDRVSLGVERAKMLARALKCHPAVLVFPGWDVRHEAAA